MTLSIGGPGRPNLAVASPKPRSTRLPLTFDVYLNLVSKPERDRLLHQLEGRLRKGDTVTLAVEGNSIARNPSLLDTLASETALWRRTLAKAGVRVLSKLRVERMKTDPSSIRPGLENLMPLLRSGRPIPNEISFDYERGGAWTGDEFTKTDTAKAGRLFKEGERLARSLGARYVVEPSVSAVRRVGGSEPGITLDWRKLARDTQGFIFQSQRIPRGLSQGRGPLQLRDYADTVKKLAAEVKGAGRDAVLAQISTEWSSPRAALASAERARAAGAKVSSYYVWWWATAANQDYGRNAGALLRLIDLRNQKDA